MAKQQYYSSVDARLAKIAYLSGKRVVGLVKEDLTPSKIMTRDAFENSIAVCMALGGSTNMVLHLPAIANEAGAKLDLKLFDDIGRKIPHLSDMLPGGPHDLEDLDRSITDLLSRQA